MIKLQSTDVLFDTSPAAMLVVDTSGNILDVNRALCEFLSYPKTYLVGRNISEFWVPEEADKNLRIRAEILQNGVSPFSHERSYQRSDGKTVTGLFHLVKSKTIDGRDVLVASLIDITDRKRLEIEKLRWGLSDRLTGFLSRANFVDICEARLDALRINYVVVSVGVDYFKHFNDRFGQREGDRLLLSIAEIIRSFGSVEAASRIGGDEFAMIIKDDDVETFSATLRSGIANSDEAISDAEKVTVSIGIAGLSSCINFETGLKNSLLAMQFAKAQGRDRDIIYTEFLRGKLSRRSKVETFLHNCIEKQMVALAYQPILTGVGRVLDGFEVLVRFDTSPLGEQISPWEMIQMAEESGIICPLGYLIFKQALEQAELWQKESAEDFTLSINVSILQLRDRDHVNALIKLLRATPMLASQIKIEVTESIFLDKSEWIAENLRLLKATGAKLFLDDFGTGYSSLTMLHSLPFDGLKLDRYFVSRIGEDVKSESLIRSTIRIAQDLKIACVAEGVETEAQAAFLTANGVDFLQGYLFDKPLDSARVSERYFRPEPQKTG